MTTNDTPDARGAREDAERKEIKEWLKNSDVLSDEFCHVQWDAIIDLVIPALRRDREERHLDKPLEQCPKCHCMIRAKESRDTDARGVREDAEKLRADAKRYIEELTLSEVDENTMGVFLHVVICALRRDRERQRKPDGTVMGWVNKQVFEMGFTDQGGFYVHSRELLPGHDQPVEVRPVEGE